MQNILPTLILNKQFLGVIFKSPQKLHEKRKGKIQLINSFKFIGWFDPGLKGYRSSDDTLRD